LEKEFFSGLVVLQESINRVEEGKEKKRFLFLEPLLLQEKNLIKKGKKLSCLYHLDIKNNSYYY